MQLAINNEVTPKQKLYFISLVEKIFASEYIRNQYYKQLPSYKKQGMIGAIQRLEKLLRSKDNF
jgi:hypothetical protein